MSARHLARCHRAAALALVGWLAGAVAGVGAADTQWLELPAFVAGETPWLARDGDGLSLSWVTREGDSFSLRASHYRDGRWRAPVTAASGRDWFNNYADFARVMPLGDGGALAVWLEMTSYRFAYYRPAAALSRNGGAAWRAVGYPAGEVDHGQLGFVSAVAHGRDAVLFWIAGYRDGAVLWRARLAPDGGWSTPEALDRQTCSCCRTAVSAGGDLVYRDRDADEMRDIALIEAAPVASASRPVHADGWQIAGCPVNGPAIAEFAGRRAIAWFTAADRRAEARLAVEPAGAAPYLAMPGERSLGLVDVAWLGPARLAVSTVTRDRGVEIHLVDVAGGVLAVERTLAIDVNTGRGAPTLAVLGEDLYVAMHDAGAGAIRVARIDAGAAQR